MSNKRIWSVALAVLVAALFAVLLWPSAPKAAAFALTDLQGQTLDQQRLQGKVTLINFWYPSCPGCVSEMPKIIALAHDYAQQPDFQVLGIALPYDPESSVRQYVRTRNISFQVAIDGSGQMAKAYDVAVAPTSFLVNKQGAVVKTYVGEPDFAVLRNQIDGLLH